MPVTISATAGGLLVSLENQVERRAMGKFRSAAEPAIANVEKLCQRTDLRIHNRGVKRALSASKRFGLRNCIGNGFRRADQIGAFILEGIRDMQQNAPNPGPAHLVLWWKISSTKKRFAVRQQKSGERPATLPGDCTDRGLVDRKSTRLNSSHIPLS